MTNLEDALAAAEAGADAIGLIFAEQSPRRVTLDQAAEIARQLPPYLVKVGVFVDAPEDFVGAALQSCGLNILQFHGNETPEYCLQFGVMSMKAVRIRDEDSLKALPKYLTAAWLLDAFSTSAAGGTGSTFNWDLAVSARSLGRPIFLAGGLTPENVAEAVSKVRPYGVDVASGVEQSPGRKDHEKMRAFVKAAKEAAAAE